MRHFRRLIKHWRLSTQAEPSGDLGPSPAPSHPPHTHTHKQNPAKSSRKANFIWWCININFLLPLQTKYFSIFQVPGLSGTQVSPSLFCCNGPLSSSERTSDSVPQLRWAGPPQPHTDPQSLPVPAAATLSFNSEHLKEKKKIKVKENHVKSQLHILYKDVIFLVVIYDHWPFWINYGTAFVSGRSNLSPRITQKATQAPCFLLSGCKSV